MTYEEKWKIIKFLDEGGQGKVYRVAKLDVNSNTKSDIIDSLRGLTAQMRMDPIREDAEDYEKFSNAVLDIIKNHDPSQHGALKVLHSPTEARDARLADERMRLEIGAMSDNLHPNLIEILDVDTDFRWYVSKFYPNGTLNDKLDIFEGNLLEATQAIRPLVEAVATLHRNGRVHRDIKPQNIFLNSNKDLILGDFGLVHFMDNEHTRISETYENVGSRDWMPPWAMGIRIDEVKPNFDVFSLGKVLWSMISGKPILRLWYFNKEGFDVEKMFSDSRAIHFANKLFAKCIVEDEKDCLPDAAALLEEIDKTISIIELGAELINLKTKRTCKVCGRGKYELVAGGDGDGGGSIHNFGFRPTGCREMKVFTCSHCGNVQFFSYEQKLPPAWEEQPLNG